MACVDIRIFQRFNLHFPSFGGISRSSPSMWDGASLSFSVSPSLSIGVNGGACTWLIETRHTALRLFPFCNETYGWFMGSHVTRTVKSRLSSTQNSTSPCLGVVDVENKAQTAWPFGFAFWRAFHFKAPSIAQLLY